VRRSNSSSSCRVRGIENQKHRQYAGAHGAAQRNARPATAFGRALQNRTGALPPGTGAVRLKIRSGFQKNLFRVLRSANVRA
jgi:hypothetical protein